MLSPEQISGLAWNKGQSVDAPALLPAIVQCANSARVLMLGYVDQQALLHSLETGRVTFYSRSKQRLWTKGESSGHFLQLIDCFADCDQDTILFLATAMGPTCHNGTQTCFDGKHESGFTPAVGPGLSFLADLDALIADRKRTRPEGSYTSKLFNGELRRIAQKVGEEGVETALAALVQDDQALVGEAADLVFHLLVLLHARGCKLDDVSRVLRARHLAP
jgi:phosphoribosyl-AMP cyclohydrolase / phosphoribosyl-ATP pyrophosphohydrolase